MTGQPTLDAHAVVLHVTSLILDAGILYENHTRGQHYVCFVQFSVKRQRRHHEGSHLQQYCGISVGKRSYCVHAFVGKKRN